MQHFKIAAMHLILIGLVISCSVQLNAQEQIRSTPWAMHVIDDTSRGADGVKLGDLNSDQLPDIVTGWEEGGVVRAYLHPGFDQVRSAWPRIDVGSAPNVEDAVFIDLDQDGNLDVVSCTEGADKQVAVHWSPSQLLTGQRWHKTPFPIIRKKARWMYAMPAQLDGANGPDVVIGCKHGPQGRGDQLQLGWLQSPQNARNISAWSWHPISPVGWIMSIVLEDMDHDGDQDVLISDRKGSHRGCRWLENPGQPESHPRLWKSHNVSLTGEKLSGEVMFIDVADINGDGLDDVIAPIKPHQVMIYQRLDQSGRHWQPHQLSVPATITGTLKAACLADLDQDGLSDIALTTEKSEGKHGVFWMKRASSNWKTKWTFHSISGMKRGIKFDRIELLDLDDDGDLDVLTCEERESSRGLGVIWYENPHILPDRN